MADLLNQPTARRAFALLLLAAAATHLPAQESDPRAVAAVRAAVAAQIEADRTDTSNWTYTDHDVTPEHDNTYFAVGSPKGEMRRLLLQHGQPVTPAVTQSETDRIAAYVNDPAAQAKNRKNQAHDDVQATALLKILPDAFIWTVTSETPEFFNLSYRPNPKFSPPDIEARVMSEMEGTLVIVRKGNLIKSFTGTLSEEVKIAFGLIGHLNKGGTIDIERRNVGSGHWEITETHVHIAAATCSSSKASAASRTK